MAERHLTYFVSDVHLGLQVKDASKREKRFISFLKSIPVDETESLYLLGDIWDFWYEYKEVVPKGFVRVFAALNDLMDSGVKVYFFQGNHDIWSYSYFEELGMIRCTQPHLVRIGDKNFCLGHGDGLGPGMIGYKIMRWAFHNKVLQRMFSSLHPRWAFAIGTGWSKRSRLAKNEEYIFKGKEEPLYRFCEEYMKKTPVDIFLFGHYHCLTDVPVGNARLLIMKDWMDRDSWIIFDSEDGSIKIH